MLGARWFSWEASHHEKTAGWKLGSQWPQIWENIWENLREKIDPCWMVEWCWMMLNSGWSHWPAGSSTTYPDTIHLVSSSIILAWQSIPGGWQQLKNMKPAVSLWFFFPFLLTSDFYNMYIILNWNHKAWTVFFHIYHGTLRQSNMNWKSS